MRLLLTKVSHYNEVALPMMAAKYHWQIQGNFMLYIKAYLGFKTHKLTRIQLKEVVTVFEEIVKDPNSISEIIHSNENEHFSIKP